MTRKQFDALVAGLAVTAQQSPRAYRDRVVLLALLGYAYVLAILALAVLLLVGVVAVAVSGHEIVGLWQLVGALVLFAGSILDSLWVRLPAPRGLIVVRHEAPDLFLKSLHCRASSAHRAFTPS